MKLTELKFKLMIRENNVVRFENVRTILLSTMGILTETDFHLNEEDVELCMYSSYTDKNGNLICHGDILKDKNGEVFAIKFNPGDGFVYYNPECCEHCKNETACIGTIEEAYMNWPIEIIGNIWENYDVLEQNKKYIHQ